MILRFQRCSRVALSESSYNLKWKSSSSFKQLRSLYGFIHESPSDAVWCVIELFTWDLDELSFLVGFSTASAKWIPQLFLQGLCHIPMKLHPLLHSLLPSLFAVGNTTEEWVKQQLGSWLMWGIFLRGNSRFLWAVLQLQRIFSLVSCVSSTVPSSSCSILYWLVWGIFLLFYCNPKMVWCDGGTASCLMWHKWDET